ncbi:hypothetical protein [Chroococcidiopsis sp. CCMEE 29]|uniref:hypothetical protein n=1 Tax=Chroococcidiopsis sp. CCMEE 29 TaxID=155894 RepID=UPI00201FE52A|nr:hypothetical protein [Chroococcidiopsis sp. CCMEE 29]
MPDSPRLDQISDPTIAKLLEVDAALASQEADLTAQLQSVQEKRKSLKSVIDMFAPADTTIPVASPVPIPASNASGKLEQTAEDQATPELDGSQAPTAANAKTQAALDEPKQKAQQAPATASTKQTAKPTRATKTAGKTQRWQQYLRDDFSDIALSDAVSIVLQEQSEQVVEIAQVVDAIFVEEIPQPVRVKARERVSNVLSEGVRKNKWYRGQEGKYSMSSAATQGQE